MREPVRCSTISEKVTYGSLNVLPIKNGNKLRGSFSMAFSIFVFSFVNHHSHGKNDSHDVFDESPVCHIIAYVGEDRLSMGSICRTMECKGIKDEED